VETEPGIICINRAGARRPHLISAQLRETICGRQHRCAIPRVLGRPLSFAPNRGLGVVRDLHPFSASWWIAAADGLSDHLLDGALRLLTHSGRRDVRRRGGL